MAVAALVDGPVVALLEALEGVRTTPPPVGQEAARVAALAHASAELRGVFLRELGAVSPQEHGARSAADLLEQHGGVPAWQARRDAGLAGRLARVPGLADAVAGGALELDAALLLVRAWQALPSRLQDDELARALVTLGQLVDLRDLRAKVDELLSALAPEVTDDDLADAREAAELTLVDVGATTRWEGTSDALTGELVREVLIKKAEGLRAAHETRTGPQLLMAALTALLEEATTDDTPGSPGLLVITDVDDLARTAEAQPDRAAPDDAVASLFEGTDLLPGSPAPARPSWGSRSRGGVPVGPRTLAALACRSVLTRLVLSPLGHPLDSSPQARQISPRERSALEHRAGYRCERAGCGRPARNCVPHHVVPWALGGPSTQANTVLLCVSCHHLLHDRLRPLLLTSGFRIGPRGWLDTSPPDDPPVL